MPNFNPNFVDPLNGQGVKFDYSEPKAAPKKKDEKALGTASQRFADILDMNQADWLKSAPFRRGEESMFWNRPGLGGADGSAGAMYGRLQRENPMTYHYGFLRPMLNPSLKGEIAQNGGRVF